MHVPALLCPVSLSSALCPAVLPCPSLLCPVLLCPSLLCSALFLSALPSVCRPALPFPALPCPSLALPCPSLPVPALLCPVSLSSALCLPSCLALPCSALPFPSSALPFSALPCSALPCFSQLCPLSAVLHCPVGVPWPALPSRVSRSPQPDIDAPPCHFRSGQPVRLGGQGRLQRLLYSGRRRSGGLPVCGRTGPTTGRSVSATSEGTNALWAP